MMNSAPRGVIPRLDALGFGGDWNPEQWPEHVWDEDLRLMREANVNLVTVNVFSWAHLEPTPGSYDFGWLDRVLDKCLEAGIAVDLATGTASPPPWLGHRWPQSLPVTEDGVRLTYGARQQYCPSSPDYRRHALALTERVASRYAEHDAVVMWHVGNEYGAHVSACWCDVSAEAFRDWLVKRYGDLDELNRAWSTSFWSQRYSDITEVIPPRRTPYFPNPTMQLDFRRFSSDEMLAIFMAERDIIRTYSPPDKPITTNFMRFFPNADYWSWASAEDVVSDDWYPDLADELSHIEGAAGADLMRSLGGGRPWLLMEQAVSAINWRSVNPPKAQGAYRRWSLQQVARGADAVLHFQWRASVGGAEKWHSGMLPHAGPRTRSWHGVVALGRELNQLNALVGATTNAKIAILLDWPSWWALELDSRPSTKLSMISILRSWYQPLWERGFSIDFAHPESDLSRYDLVLIPQLYAVTDQGARRVAAAVEAGTHIAVGYFSAAVDEFDRVRTGGYPAPWTDLLGIWIEEYRPLLPGQTMQLRAVQPTQGEDAICEGWSEHVHLSGAEAVLTYVGGDLDGLPAVTRRDTGDACAWYISAGIEQNGLARVLDMITSRAGVEPILPNRPPSGIEVALRETTSERFLFLLNHSQTDHEVELPSVPAPGWAHAASRQEATDHVTVSANDVIILVTPSPIAKDSR